MFLLIAAPLIQTILLGYAVDFDFEEIPTVVVDLDRSHDSRMHARRLLADRTFRRRPGGTSGVDAIAPLASGQAAAAIVLPPGLQSDLLARRPSQVQILLDGADPNRAMVVAGAAARYFAETTEELLRKQAAGAGLVPPPTIRAVPRALYNPTLATAPFMVSGVMTMLLLIVTTIVTAMGLSREREMGTLEQVLVTPIRPIILLLGKMVPFLVIGCVDVFLVLTAGVWIFGVPMNGPASVLVAGTLLYLSCTLGIGLLISAISKTQQQAFLAGFLYIMPAILLSGFMTPVLAMPAWLRTITYVNPVRYFVEILRANLLKGAGFSDLWWRLLALGILGSLILFVATLRFKKRVG